MIRIRFMSEADRRAYAVAANRLAELSKWDEELLAAELEFLFEEDYDLGVTGFNVSDLDFAVAGDEDTAEPHVELPGTDDPVTHSGRRSSKRKAARSWGSCSPP